MIILMCNQGSNLLVIYYFYFTDRSSQSENTNLSHHTCIFIANNSFLIISRLDNFRPKWFNYQLKHPFACVMEITTREVTSIQYK